MQYTLTRLWSRIRRESFSASPAEHFLGGGEDGDFVDLRNHVAPQRTGYGCGSEFPMPYFVSSAGYGIFARALSIGQIAFPGTEGVRTCDGVTPQCPLTPTTDRIELCFKQATLRYEVYAGTPTQVMRAFSADAGRAPPRRPSSSARRSGAASGTKIASRSCEPTPRPIGSSGSR